MTVPSWAAQDWPQALLGAAAVVAGVVVVALGLFLVSLVAGSAEDLPAFQTTLLLSSLAFGAGIAIEAWNGAVTVPALAVPLVLTTTLLARAATRRIAGTLMADVVRFRAFSVKIAIGVATLTLALTRLASIPFTDSFTAEEVRYAPSSGRAFGLGFLLVVVGAMLARSNHQHPLPSSRLERVKPVVRSAVAAYGSLAVISLMVVLGYGLVEADDVGFRELIALLVLVVCFGGTLAGATAASSLGAPATITGVWSDEFDEGTLHLFSSGSPSWVKLMLIVAPVVVGVFTWRQLMRTRPATQPDLARFAAMTGACFALCSFVGALIGGVSLEISALSLFGIDEYLQVQLSYDLVLVVILGLAWGLLGSFAAAIVWGRQHGVPLITTAAVSASIPSGVRSAAPPMPPSLPVVPVSVPSPPSDATFTPRLDAPPPDPSTRRD